MNHIESYYKNICEQLQQQIDLLEKKIEEKKKKLAKGKEKKAAKDYDGDGEIETGKEEYFGSRDKAIKKNMAKKKGLVDKKKKEKLDEGRVIGGGKFLYGGFPRVLNEQEVVDQFNDGDDGQGPATATDAQEEVLWSNPKLVYRGYRYPSTALMGLAQTADTLQGQYLSQRAKNKDFEGSAQGKQLGGELDAARMALYSHPHWNEFRKGSPEKRNAPMKSVTFAPGTVIDTSREGT